MAVQQWRKMEMTWRKESGPPIEKVSDGWLDVQAWKSSSASRQKMRWRTLGLHLVSCVPIVVILILPG